MFTRHGHLTYCTNIHAGESWPDHFTALKENIPLVKSRIAPNIPMGLGLRLSHLASTRLIEREELETFKNWLSENNLYVFTLNGFPYGGFHRTRVKDDVHTPDWTTRERVEYTKRNFNILKELLPAGMDGGQSTSPLSYRHWFKTAAELEEATKKATAHIAEIAIFLAQIYEYEGKHLHLDIEPEPDGILETGEEFLSWYNNELIPIAADLIAAELNIDRQSATIILKKHIGLCYDVCHFAIGYEPHEAIIQKVEANGIIIGKIQISAALKGNLAVNAGERKTVTDSFAHFNESTYLHQVVAKTISGDLIRYRDLPEALNDSNNEKVTEWRAHFHVPVAATDYGVLLSTQDAIMEVLDIQKKSPFTKHLEVETYTWEVLPAALKLPLTASIIREMEWVIDYLEK
jgi:hypothetical protein